MNSAARQPVLSACHGATLVLTLNVPEKRNVLGPAIYDGLNAGLDLALADAGIANIVLQGAGGFFCAGGDLNQLATRAALPPAERAARIELLHRLVRRIRSCPKPVIAAIEGGAAGAGASIALAADLIVAAEDSYMSMAYVKAGLVPDGGGTASLLRALPPQAAAELALLGGRFPARRLAELGVINRLVPAGQALQAALGLASELAQGARGRNRPFSRCSTVPLIRALTISLRLKRPRWPMHLAVQRRPRASAHSVNVAFRFFRRCLLIPLRRCLNLIPPSRACSAPACPLLRVG
ncbi:enoyl-CoA hydratase-related protein [Paracoccus kondratievae]